MAAILILVGGVTFAALRSQNNVLEGSRMTSASANLQMSRTASGPWSNNMSGFTFNDIMPGGDPAPRTGTDLYLKNTGTTNMTLQYSVNLNGLVNGQGINLSKVKIVITDSTGLTVYVTGSIAELGQAYTSGTPITTTLALPKGTTSQVKVMMQLDEDAVSNSSSQVVIDGINIVFSGLVQSV